MSNPETSQPLPEHLEEALAHYRSVATQLVDDFESQGIWLRNMPLFGDDASLYAIPVSAAQERRPITEVLAEIDQYNAQPDVNTPDSYEIVMRLMQQIVDKRRWDQALERTMDLRNSSVWEKIAALAEQAKVGDEAARESVRGELTGFVADEMAFARLDDSVLAQNEPPEAV